MAEPVVPGKIDFDHRDHVTWVTVNNAARRNAMSLQMWQALDAGLACLPDQTRCVVLRGAGDVAFVSGADISEFSELRRAPELRAVYDAAADSAMARLYDLTQPTVAMISGYCFGAGVALALCCDVRLAARNSIFSVPAGRLGVGYGARDVKKLIDVVGIPAALDIMVSARRYTALEALRIGLVNRIHPTAKLADELESYVGQIVRNAPLTVQAIKHSIRTLARLDSALDLTECDRRYAACFASEDYAEGIAAFLEKRSPNFDGR